MSSCKPSTRSDLRKHAPALAAMQAESELFSRETRRVVFYATIAQLCAARGASSPVGRAWHAALRAGQHTACLAPHHSPPLRGPDTRNCKHSAIIHISATVARHRHQPVSEVLHYQSAGLVRKKHAVLLQEAQAAVHYVTGGETCAEPSAARGSAAPATTHAQQLPREEGGHCNCPPQPHPGC